MRALAQCEVRVVFAAEIEFVGVLELGCVAVGRNEADSQNLAGTEFPSANLEALHNGAIG